MKFPGWSQYMATSVPGADCDAESPIRPMVGPEAGSPFQHRRVKRMVRHYRVTKFPYDVVVTVEGDELVVLAVSAHKRRPGYWIRRLKNL